MRLVTALPILTSSKRVAGFSLRFGQLLRQVKISFYQKTLEQVTTALELGTTTLEIKSGYGLDTENELKMLRIIDRVAKSSQVDMVATFLGAHAVPTAFVTSQSRFIIW